MALRYTDAAGVDLGIVAIDAEGGTRSDPVTVQIWYEPDDGSTDPLVGLLVVAEARVPGTTAWVRKGLPELDEGWIEARLVGHDNAARPEQLEQQSEWTSLGAYSALPTEDLYPDNSRIYELTVRAPSSLEDAYRTEVRLRVWLRKSLPLPGRSVHRGIYVGVGDREQTGLVRGAELTTTGTDVVSCAARYWLDGGVPTGHIGDQVTLDQTDGAAVALASGEAYIALLALDLDTDGDLVAIKGLLAAAPVRPALPARHLLIDSVQVDWVDSAPSEIDDADLGGETRYLRHRVEAGAGTTLRVHGGRAVGVASLRIRSGVEELLLAASATSYLWQLGSGDFDITAALAAPALDALGPWAEITTDLTDITAIEMTLAYAERAVRLELRDVAVPASPSDIVGRLRVPERCAIDEVRVYASDDSSTTGATVFDLETDTVSIYPGSATEDLRPSFAAGAPLAHTQGIPDGDRTLAQGSEVVVRVVTWSDVPPARVTVHIICYPLP